MSQQLASYPCSFGSAKIIFYANKEGRMPESVVGWWRAGSSGEESHRILLFSLQKMSCPTRKE